MVAFYSVHVCAYMEIHNIHGHTCVYVVCVHVKHTILT